MRCGCALGRGSACPSIAARDAPAGSQASQVRTGNAAGCDEAKAPRGDRGGMVAAGMRTLIGCTVPSTSICGHCEAAVMTRATAAPAGPSST